MDGVGLRMAQPDLHVYAYARDVDDSQIAASTVREVAQPRVGGRSRQGRCGIILSFSRPAMEAERLNAIAARLADLKSRELELRRYL